MRVVLIVEDDQIQSHALASILAQAGHVPLIAATARLALKTLATEKVDAVVLDLWLPDMHGLELLHRVRRDSRWRNLPVIIYSADRSAATIMTAKRAGATDYLVKAKVKPEELHRRLAEYMSQSE